MNKLILCGLLIWTSLSFSQVSFGVKGGVNLSSLSVENEFIQGALSSRVGYHFGVTSKFDFTEKIGLQPELYYSRQGFSAGEIELRDSADNIPVIAKQFVNLSYINIPVLINYNAVAGFDIQAGPQFGLGLSSKSGIKEVSGDISEFEDDFTFNTDISTIEIGLAAGVQYRLEKLFFQARYVLGLTGTGKDGKGGKNRNAQLSIGYKLF